MTLLCVNLLTQVFTKIGPGLRSNPTGRLLILSMNEKELAKLISTIEKKMKKAAADLNFEAAAELRDKMTELKKIYIDMTSGL